MNNPYPFLHLPPSRGRGSHLRTSGCSLATRAKYTVAKVQLALDPVLAGLEFFSEPAQLLSFPFSMTLPWSGDAAGSSQQSNSFLAGLQAFFAAVMLSFSGLPYWVILGLSLSAAWTLIAAW